MLSWLKALPDFRCYPSTFHRKSGLNCAVRSFSYKKSGSLNRDWRVRSTISTDRAYSRARYRAVAAPVDFKLCTDVRKYRLSAQNEISLFFHQGNSESRYKERRTRFFRRIPHFPRSRGARAPGMWLFQDKSFRLDKTNSIRYLRISVLHSFLPCMQR